MTLRLRGGENEVLFAASESLGGWGILAAVPPVPGVRVESSAVQRTVSTRLSMAASRSSPRTFLKRIVVSPSTFGAA